MLAAKGAPRERLRSAPNPILNRQMLRRPAAQWTAALLAALLTIHLRLASANSVGVQALDGQLQPPSSRLLVRRALLQVEAAVTDAASQGSSLYCIYRAQTPSNVRGIDAQELQCWAASKTPPKMHAACGGSCTACQAHAQMLCLHHSHTHMAQHLQKNGFATNQA